MIRTIRPILSSALFAPFYSDRSRSENNVSARHGHAQRPRIGVQIALLAMISLAAVTATALGARALMARIPTPIKQDQGVNQDAAKPKGPTTAIVTLGQFGFEPAELSLPAGPVFIAVSVRGRLTPTFTLSRTQGGRVVSEKYLQKKRHWEKVLTLPPGEYLLTSEEAPGRACRISVLPPGRQ